MICCQEYTDRLISTTPKHPRST